MKIYVGNLSFNSGEDAIRRAFQQFGEVASVQVISDKFTGKSRGFGFVEMNDQSEGSKAVEGLNGSELDGRTIVVNEARPRTEKPPQRRQRY